MATNYVQRGDVIDIEVAGAVASGDGVLNSYLFGVALNTTTAAGTVPCGVVGVFQLAKLAGLAINQGDRVFWDTTPGEVNKTAAGQPCIGVCAEDASAGATVCKVLLRPIPLLGD